MLNGPPFIDAPSLFAGTINEYSSSAIPQLIKIAVIIPEFFKKEMSLKRKCPYQAIVIKELDAIKSNMVEIERDIINQYIF